MKGIVYMIPLPLGENDPIEVIPATVYKVINDIDTYIVENIRTARRYLRKINIQKPIDSLRFLELNEHTQATDIVGYLDDCVAGRHVGVMSEAGCPGVADPGSAIARMAHQKGIRVIPMVGPSSILLSLMASGFNGQSFAFNGYLPVKSPERSSKLKALELKAGKEHQTQIFIEAPYRNNQMVQDILTHCNPSTLLCIACDISLETEFIKTLSVGSWKSQVPELHKKPVIFLLNRD